MLLRENDPPAAKALIRGAWKAAAAAGALSAVSVALQVIMQGAPSSAALSTTDSVTTRTVEPPPQHFGRRPGIRYMARHYHAYQPPPPAPPPPPPPPPAPPQPSGSPQQIALAMLGSYGWSSSEFGCLDQLWIRESGWNPQATNPYSGAFGIPQSLPGSKMASAGADWATNPATQIRWGLGYIREQYGSPCGAWSHELATGAY